MPRGYRCHTLGQLQVPGHCPWPLELPGSSQAEPGAPPPQGTGFWPLPPFLLIYSRH